MMVCPGRESDKCIRDSLLELGHLFVWVVMVIETVQGGTKHEGAAVQWKTCMACDAIS